MEQIIDYITPIISYNSIKVNNVDISLSSRHKVSFTAPYNRIDFIMTPTNGSLSYYEVRITQESGLYDIGVGNLAYWDANIQNAKPYSFSISINSTNFSYGDGVYRVSLYAKSAIDGSWDATYLLFTIDGEQFIPSDASGFEVLTTRDAPQN